MINLENDYLRVRLRSQGAELTSLIDKITGTEHLWQADPSVWGWHAPNLFPIVGGLIDDQFHVDGQSYRMGRHGFARQSEFALTESTSDKAVFALTDSEQTRTMYPFAFLFEITYLLDANVLTVLYRVTNRGSSAMYFSVGAHPAFAVPFSSGEAYTDYLLEFQKEEPLERHLLSAEGLFTGETEPVLAVGNQLPLTADLFSKDALVFKNLESTRVTLKSPNHDHSVTVSYPGFPYLGLWAKPGASFVCIEPWLGCADSEGREVDIRQKEAIQSVDAGASFEAGFSIAVN